METQTEAGRLTELVMANITRKIGKMPAHNYNAIWSAVLEVMQRELEAPKVKLQSDPSPWLQTR